MADDGRQGCWSATPTISWRCARTAGKPSAPFRRSRRSSRAWVLSPSPRRPGSCISPKVGRALTSSAFTTAGCAPGSRDSGTSASSLAGPHGGRCSAPATVCESSRRAIGCAGRSSRSSQDLNRFLRGWAGYFRYGNSTVQFDQITRHADDRLALLIGKRHQRPWRYGRQVLASRPDRYGLISLNGTVAAPRPNRPWRPGAECRR